MLEKKPNSLVGQYLNKDILKSSVDRYRGRALATYDTDAGRFNLPEEDFLRIGRKK